VSKKSSLAALILLCSGASAARFEAIEPHMGTLFRITLYAPDQDRAQAAFHAAFLRVKQLDDALSDYKEDSELMKLCRTAYERPVPVSADLFSVLDAAQQLAQETGGAFDVTLGPVIRLWRQRRLPSVEALHAAMQKSGYQKLLLDRSKRTVRLQSDGMQLDLGAIAKGYAADQALKVLRDYEIHSALVAASGDIAVGDAPPGTPGWRIAIECPEPKVVTLQSAAISTSGDTEQYLEIGGIRYSHIIDPKTGMGLTDRICATVVSDLGIHADSLATALSVLTAQRGWQFGLRWIDRHSSASARIVRKTTGGWEVHESQQFPLVAPAFSR
jgi:thiamine biosynthesis lipoprotein